MTGPARMCEACGKRPIGGSKSGRRCAWCAEYGAPLRFAGAVSAPDVLDAALAKHGAREQMDQAVEELAELIVAINHRRRGRINVDALAEEIADVSIMLDQLGRIVGPEIVAAVREKKLARLAERLGFERAPAEPAPAMPLVILESPYAGDVRENVAYARRAMLDSLSRGEAPIASHLLYPQALDDLIPGERRLGIEAGLAWRRVADLAVFYEDRGWSPGMLAARELYDREGKRYEVRRLSPAPDEVSNG